MSDHHDPALDPRLAELLSDAVSDVEPGERLDSIRNRTKVNPMSARRPWLLAVGGAVVATAAVITAIALATGDSAPTTEPGPATSPPTVASDTPSPSTSTTSPPAPAGGAVPVYFAGDTPQGARLYREFQRNVDGLDPLLFAARSSVEGTAHDGDYRSLWPAGTSVGQVSLDGADIITVSVDGAPHDLPAGMSRADAAMALQQVVYSVQAALGQGRVGVQLLLDGDRSDQVLGQPTSEPLAAAPVLQTLSHVSLTTPEEGAVVRGNTLEVTGVASSFEANVVARLQRYEGTEVMAQVPFTAEGWMGERLFPFSGEIDVSDVPAGRYILMVMTDDPSGGAEGGGAYTDTRIIEVE